MKVKSILGKAAIAAVSASGIAVVNNAQTSKVQAATVKSDHKASKKHAKIVKNDTAVVTVNYVDGNGIRVWDSYKQTKATGQVLPSNSSWKVIKTAYDKKGQKWYDLGKNQWVRAEYVNKGYYPANEAPAPAVTTSEYATEDNGANGNYTISNQTYSSTSVSVPATSGSESSAKDWIANRESGGSYSAQNGQYIGKYQLTASYLNGDYSAANQERVADSYVKGRYGSWTAAKQFWEANGWY
ncbi:hypothetical protein [Lactobacillus xylocopicola]|uniref:Peptidoglycan-binding protein n=1 Tax=Lactobacillus xylocopicola TaxID=2976676 RepID=A0ABM8BFQ4_9LACO|nr:hypothetical protein [Lactobacillus xylocopicola]BDR60061.1 peptidoglycan-binding protein [Lactobacillus xylocopicola]